MDQNRPQETSDLDMLLNVYLEARGIPLPIITTGQKAVEEAGELVDAIASGDLARIHQELADVVLVAAVVARQYGTTVEACIREKAKYDLGRGDKPSTDTTTTDPA